MDDENGRGGRWMTKTIENAVLSSAGVAPHLVLAALVTSIVLSQTVEAFTPSPAMGRLPSGTTALMLAFRTEQVSENRPTPWFAAEGRTSVPSLLENFEASLFASKHDEEDNDEDYPYDDLLIDSLDSIQKLQQASGPNVLSTKEQTLVDQSDVADAFLKNFGGADVSHIEKVAMGSIPEQLPQAPLGAFLDRNKPQQKGNSQTAYMNHSRQRVSVEQELHLGRLIQAGAKVFQIKTNLESTLQREPTKHEWAKAAGFTSAKELRHTVAAYRTAKHMLVTANMGLVHSVVKRGRRRRGVSVEEMIQEGSLGLLRAAELFDPTKGLRFSTYAVVWIKGMLANTHVAEFVRLPERERTKWNKINQAAAALRAQNLSNDTPSAEAIATCSGIPLNDVLDVLQHMTPLQSQNMVSLDAPIYMQHRFGSEDASSPSVTPHGVISYDDEGLEEHAQLRADIIASLASNLTPREARLMRLRYGLTDGQSRSLQQCADAMGLSRSSVTRLDKDCLTKLREASDAQSLEEYLLTIL
jgi:RNA polymerase nonessential primary-like sigma factor